MLDMLCPVLLLYLVGNGDVLWCIASCVPSEESLLRMFVSRSCKHDVGTYPCHGTTWGSCKSGNNAGSFTSDNISIDDPDSCSSNITTTAIV